MRKTLLVVPVLVVAAGCGSAPAADADRSACVAFDQAARSAEVIEVATVPELAKEQARMAASQAETAAAGASSELAERMRTTAGDLEKVAEVAVDAQLVSPGGPMPDITAQMDAVRSDIEGVTSICRTD